MGGLAAAGAAAAVAAVGAGALGARALRPAGAFRVSGIIAKVGTKGSSRSWTRGMAVFNRGKIGHLARRHGMNTSQYLRAVDDHMKTMIDSSEIRIRLNGETSLAGVLSQGRFGTVFDAGKRGALVDPWVRGTRRFFEQKLYNYPTRFSNRQRLVYGHLYRKGSGDLLKGKVSMYGDADVVLKHATRERTTFAMGDTLFQNAGGLRHGTAPQPMTNPNWRAGLYRDRKNQWRGDPLDMKEIGEAPRGMHYVETQIHGGVTVRDIEKVIFTKAPSARVKTLLARHKIPWYMREAD
jgi:hypothetical protein